MKKEVFNFIYQIRNFVFEKKAPPFYLFEIFPAPIFAIVLSFISDDIILLKKILDSIHIYQHPSLLSALAASEERSAIAYLKFKYSICDQWQEQEKLRQFHYIHYRLYHDAEEEKSSTDQATQKSRQIYLYFLKEILTGLDLSEFTESELVGTIPFSVIYKLFRVHNTTLPLIYRHFLINFTRLTSQLSYSDQALAPVHMDTHLQDPSLNYLELIENQHYKKLCCDNKTVLAIFLWINIITLGAPVSYLRKQLYKNIFCEDKRNNHSAHPELEKKLTDYREQLFWQVKTYLVAKVKTLDAPIFTLQAIG